MDSGRSSREAKCFVRLRPEILTVRIFWVYFLGALIIRIRVWGPSYYNYNKEFPK